MKQLNTSIKHNAIKWGDDPELFGPKDWFRNTLILKEVLRYIKKGNIVDFGCGSGILLKRFSKYKAYNSIGIDVTKANVDYARKKLSNNKNVKIYLGSLALLKNIKNIKGIICGETLEHLRDDRQAIKTFYKSLTPGGYVIVSVPAHPTKWTEIDVYAGHYRRYENDSLREVFEQQGFKTIHCVYWGYPIGLLWDYYISYPVLRRKMRNTIIYSNTNSIFAKLLQYTRIKSFISYIFFIDSFFFKNNKRGNGLLLVARKPLNEN